MKQFWKIFFILVCNVIITYGLIRYFVLSDTLVIEGKLEQNIIADQKEIIIATGAIFSGSISLQEGNVTIQDYAKVFGDVRLDKGNLTVGKSVEIQGNMYVKGQVILGEESIVQGDINNSVDLYKHSRAKVSGMLPSLYITSDYPEYLQYFDALPSEHKQNLGYIYYTTNSIDIRGKDMPPREYFKAIYHYSGGVLQKLTLSDDVLQKHYDNTKNYINKISDTRARRYAVAFTTLHHAFDKKKADIYISSAYANSELFVHEFGHVQDFAHNYIDYHVPAYPYRDKKNAITEYGKYHKGEDFAEGYRFYVLHNIHFQNKAKNNPEIQEKYDYFRKTVFKGKKYVS